MLLRSIELMWKPRELGKRSKASLCPECEIFQQYPGQGFWNECKLAIHWNYDSDALTKQGLEKIQQRKLQPQLKKLQEEQKELEGKQELLKSLEQKIPEAARSKAQIRKIESLKEAIQKRQADLAKPRPKLNCLRDSQSFDRPDRLSYEGVPNIFVGVLLDLEKHLVVTIVDATRRKVLAIRNARSISEEGYNLLQRYFRQRHEHSKQRRVDQKAHRHVHQTESGLGSC
jgi:arginyl-tRNA--protein-N-Asp/Glu arginylyltransferase